VSLLNNKSADTFTSSIILLLKTPFSFQMAVVYIYRTIVPRLLANTWETVNWAAVTVATQYTL
jgi:hypothetical protein